MSLLKQDITRRGQIDKEFINLDPNQELDLRNNKEYEVKSIKDSVVHTKKAQNQLPGLYYLIFWKDFPKEVDTWKPVLAILHL